MMVRSFLFICFVLLGQVLPAQGIADEWMQSQLDKITWQESYKGVLADFHPVTLVLASDQSQVAGYLIHDADQRKHRLVGDWNTASRFQLQERDEFDRLTGYLTGTVSNDQAILKWISADQNRVFDVKAFPSHLIKIKNFKTVAEWISVEAAKPIFLSVQKMDYGIVSGIAQIDGLFRRFDGQCLDGTCSIWKAEVRDEKGAVYTIQMRQKDPVTYKAILAGVEYKANIQFTTPLAVRQFDNSAGFLDFVYPGFDSKVYDAWISSRVDSMWTKGVKHLTAGNEMETPGRLIYRSSGWVEIIDENESHVTGMITFIHPDQVQREVFVWLKKEDAFVLQDELMNTPGDLSKASSLALASSDHHTDKDYSTWLQDVGYTLLLPTAGGVAMTTEFNMVYGDELQLLSMEESKSLIKRKYWKYFGW
jgi:hypothetical protein